VGWKKHAVSCGDVVRDTGIELVALRLAHARCIRGVRQGAVVLASGAQAPSKAVGPPPKG
jgi:hypothetical protein